MANPTYDLFGLTPNTVLLRTSDNFSGAAPYDFVANPPELSPGLAELPEQAGGGLIDFHRTDIVVTDIILSAGSVTPTLVYPSGAEAALPTVTPTVPLAAPISLPQKVKLKLVSTGSGAKSCAVVAKTVRGGLT